MKALINVDFLHEKTLNFTDAIWQLKSSMDWDKKSIVNEFFKMIPKFGYHDNGKYLDGKMWFSLL